MRRQAAQGIAAAWSGLARWLARTFILPLLLGLLVLHIFRNSLLIRYFAESKSWAYFDRFLWAWLIGLLIVWIFRKSDQEARQRNRNRS